MAIDTLAYVKTLEAAGIPREQAEAQVAALAHHVLSDLATTADLAHLATKADVAELKGDLAEFKLATKADIADLKGDLHEFKLATKADLAEMKYDLSWRFFGMTVGVVGLMDAILFALLRFGH
jgi:hypothetical protein